MIKKSYTISVNFFCTNVDINTSNIKKLLFWIIQKFVTAILVKNVV